MCFTKMGETPTSPLPLPFPEELVGNYQALSFPSDLDKKKGERPCPEHDKNREALQ